jgi:hypothetical protein
VYRLCPNAATSFLVSAVHERTVALWVDKAMSQRTQSPKTSPQNSWIDINGNNESVMLSATAADTEHKTETKNSEATSTATTNSTTPAPNAPGQTEITSPVSSSSSGNVDYEQLRHEFLHDSVTPNHARGTYSLCL